MQVGQERRCFCCIGGRFNRHKVTLFDRARTNEHIGEKVQMSHQSSFCDAITLLGVASRSRGVLLLLLPMSVQRERKKSLIGPIGQTGIFAEEVIVHGCLISIAYTDLWLSNIYFLFMLQRNSRKHGFVIHCNIYIYFNITAS